MRRLAIAMEDSRWTSTPRPTTATTVVLDELWPPRAVRYAGALIVISGLINLSMVMVAPVESVDVVDTLLDMAVGGALFTLSFTLAFRERWQLITWIGVVLVVVCDSVTAAAHGEFVMLLVTTMLMMVGASAILPWSASWQASFNLFCFAAWSAIRLGAGQHDAEEATQWIGVLTAAVIAQVITAMRERHAREREMSERKIRESEEKLRKVFEASSDVIAIATENGYVDVNPAFEMFGYSREEATGYSDQSISLWPTPADRIRFYEQVFTQGRVKNLEVTLRAKNGSTIPCLVSAVKSEWQGKPCVIAVGRDITPLKETERQLIAAREQALAASRAKSEFLSSMSHEIRTPLNAILGMTELLLESSCDSEQLLYLHTMMDNGNALLGLINDVLDLSRIERGKLALEQTDFDLKELSDRLIETLGMQAREKALRLSARIEPDVPTALVGDPLRLRQVLVNLVGNAIKFTERGSVTLTVSRKPGGDPGSILFSVTDTGIGIAPNDLEQIFGSFVQADSSTARKYGGSGLGLSIAKRLVELMDGEIRAQSELGRGSIFSFSVRFGVQPASTQLASIIPVSRTPAATNGASHSSGPALPDRALRILLADDSDDNRLLVVAFLKGTPYVIDEVENGALAVEHFIADKYDLVLMDIQMPVMDGHAATRAIREWERNNHRTPTPIVALTASALAESFVLSRAAGCDEHVTKPIRKAVLLEVIARATA